MNNIDIAKRNCKNKYKNKLRILIQMCEVIKFIPNFKSFIPHFNANLYQLIQFCYIPLIEESFVPNLNTNVSNCKVLS